MAVLPIAEGERWVYSKTPDVPVEVTVLKVVSQSGNANVRIQLEDGPKAGEIRWVSRRTLKAPWAQLNDFLDLERRWQALREAGQRSSRSAQEAASMAIDLIVRSEVAWGKAGGILAVRDLKSLSAVAPAAIPDTAGGSSIEQDGVVYFAWPAMLDVGQALAQVRPGVILDYVMKEQAEWLEMDSSTDGGSQWAKVMISACELMRSWCGETAESQWLEIVRLRKDNARLHELLGKALTVLESQKDSYLTHQAKRLRGEAGRAFGKAPDWIKNL